VTILALQRQMLPPNAHCATPDPQCALNLVLQTGVRASGLQAAISSSFAFGGTNAVLAFKLV
jgi:3-oxoacyl-[acyl-carrier-protein] synthase II